MEIFTLIAIHTLCNEIAEVRLVSQSEAVECNENFEYLKFSLHPEYTYKEYRNLKANDQAKISVEAYQYYLDWRNTNPEIFKSLTEGAEIMVLAGMSHLKN